MKVKLYCPHCDLKIDANIYGKDALKIIQRYDHIIMGRPFCFRCTCGHDLHIMGTLINEPYTFKEDIDRNKNHGIIKQNIN